MADNRKTLSLSVFWTLMVKVAGLGLGFGVSAATARLLTPDGFGLFSVFVTVINVLAVTGTLGSHFLILRAAGRQAAEQAGLAGMRELCGRILRKMLVFAVLGTCAGTAYLHVTGLAGSYATTIIIVAVFLGGAYSVNITLSSFVRARKAVVEAQVLQGVLRPAGYLLALGLVLLFLGRSSVGLGEAVTMMVGAGLAGVAVSMARFRKYYGGYPVLAAGTRHPAGEGLRWFAFINAAQVLNENMDMLLLGALGVAQDAAMYRVAFSIAMLISFPVTAAVSAFAPWYSESVARRDWAGLHRLAGWSGLAISLVTVAGAAILVMFAGLLLRFAFGAAYVAAAPVLTVLVIGQVINGIAGPVALLLNFMHDEKFVFGTLLTSLAISTTLNFMLIPVYGATGAAVSNAVAIGVWNVILIGRALFRHRINPTFTALASHRHLTGRNCLEG